MGEQFQQFKDYDRKIEDGEMVNVSQLVELTNYTRQYFLSKSFLSKVENIKKGGKRYFNAEQAEQYILGK